MDDRILLSSYTIKISGKDKNYHILSNINNSFDFITLFKQFTDDIYQNINRTLDGQSRHTVHLTLEDIAKFEETDNRRLYGFFSSGISGERYKVVDTLTNEEEMDVQPHHAAFRNVFFYLYVPQQKNVAYLILQRKSQFGIKLRLRSVLNQYFIDKGYNDLTLQMNNILHTRVYRKMMTDGKLKKVELIKRKIPRSIEEFMNNNEQLEEIKGTFRTSFTSRTSLPESWKDYIDRRFRQQNSQNGTIEIQNLDDNYTDLEFELELNGKKKTFFMMNQQRIQPDIDVTQNIIFENGEPTVDTLIQQAKELINDLTQTSPTNA